MFVFDHKVRSFISHWRWYCLFYCNSVFSPQHLSVCSPVLPFVSACLPACLPVHVAQSVCLWRLSVCFCQGCLSVCVCLSVIFYMLSICLCLSSVSLCLSVRLCVYLSLCLHAWLPEVTELTVIGQLPFVYHNPESMMGTKWQSEIGNQKFVWHNRYWVIDNRRLTDKQTCPPMTCNTCVLWSTGHKLSFIFTCSVRNVKFKHKSGVMVLLVAHSAMLCILLSQVQIPAPSILWWFAYQLGWYFEVL